MVWSAFHASFIYHGLWVGYSKLINELITAASGALYAEFERTVNKLNKLERLRHVLPHVKHQDKCTAGEVPRSNASIKYTRNFISGKGFHT